MAEVAIESAETMLHGSVLVLLQFDVCEAIRLDQLRELIRPHTVEHTIPKHAPPGYVRYQRPPVVEAIEPLVLESGERLQGEIKYYDYGVLSVVFELAFSGGWEKLTGLASRWVWDVDFAAQATEIVRGRLARAAPALVKPYAEWLSEDYLIFHVREISGSPSVADLIYLYGSRIAQVVRGDMGQLAESEIHEVLQSRISYYANDIAIIGWNAAFIYDSTSGAQTAIANTSRAPVINIAVLLKILRDFICCVFNPAYRPQAPAENLCNRECPISTAGIFQPRFSRCGRIRQYRDSTATGAMETVNIWQEPRPQRDSKDCGF